MKFVEAGRCWKILEIYGNKVYVAPEEDPTGAVPSWVGDEIPVPLPVALEVGSIRREYAEALGSGGRGEQSVIDSFRERYPVDADAIALSLSEVKEQVSLGLAVPSDRLVTIEKWDKYLVIQATFGHRVNRLLARVVAHILSERMGQSVAVHQDPYRIILEVDSSPRLVEAVIRELAGKDVKELARAAVERCWGRVSSNRLINCFNSEV